MIIIVIVQTNGYVHISSVLLFAKKKTTCECEPHKKTLPGVSSFPPAALPLPPGSSGSSGSCCRSSADNPAQNSRNSQLQWTWWHERGEIKGAPFCWLGDLLGDGPIYIYINGCRFSTIIRIPFLNNQLLRLWANILNWNTPKEATFT